MARDLSGFELHVRESAALSRQERGRLLELFERNYRQANPLFLEQSVKRLRYVATANKASVLVGFALGDTRELELPRLGRQVVSLAGIACVAPAFRRRGLFGELARRALSAAAVPPKPRRLVCGRMAHPAAMRTMSRLPTAVPRAGLRPTPWQRKVGQAIAEAYGAHDFDADTFVCIGAGVPIGYPKIEFELDPQEWEVFRPVDRDRGDALLAIAWVPDAPPGW